MNKGHNVVINQVGPKKAITVNFYEAETRAPGNTKGLGHPVWILYMTACWDQHNPNEYLSFISFFYTLSSLSFELLFIKLYEI